MQGMQNFSETGINLADGFLDNEMEDKFLTFAVDKDEYGVEIRYVVDIIGMQKITEVPELPDYLKGIVNLRGKVFPVMDVRVRFKKEAIEYNDRTCIIVIDMNDTTVGLIVDTVLEVVDIPERSVVEPPELRSSTQNKYIKGIGKVGQNVKLLLDCNRLFTDGEKLPIADFV